MVKQCKTKKKFDWKGYLFVWSILLMPVILFIYSNGILNVEVVRLAFQNAKGEWTLGNFAWAIRDMTEEGSVMMESLKNTMLFFVNSIIVINFFNLLLSYFLFKRVLGYKIFRIVLYLPSIIGSVAFSLVFKAIIGAGGPVYEIMEKMFGVAPEIFADSRYAMKGILFYVSWTGLGGLFYQGAMARIPTDVFEAAILDGITPWKEFTKIIIPMIWPTITTLLILSFTGIFSASGPILLFTKGEYGTFTISYWLWDQVYTWNAVHSAAVVGLIYTLIATPIVFIFRKVALKVQESVQY